MAIIADDKEQELTHSEQNNNDDLIVPVTLYFFVFAGDALGAAGDVAGLAGEAAGADCDAGGAAGDACCAGAGVGLGVTTGALSGVDCNTERDPVSVGKPSVNAINMNAAAAPIVILASKLAVPRGPNAVLDKLLEKSAPASALPG